MCVLSHFSCVRLFTTRWTVGSQAPLSMGFSRKERILEWVAMPSSRHLPKPGIELVSHVSCIGRWVLYHWVTLKQAYYVSLFLRSAQNSSFNSVPVSTVKWIKMEYGCQCACVCLCVHTYMFMCLK